jgi:hypothetical protein
MLTRIGDYAQNQLTTKLLLDTQSRAREAQIQISTGKVGTSFSDIADGTSRLVSTKAALQRVQAFQTNNQLVNDRLDAMPGDRDRPSAAVGSCARRAPGARPAAGVAPRAARRGRRSTAGRRS